jgi:hypothetical protein
VPIAERLELVVRSDVGGDGPVRSWNLVLTVAYRISKNVQAFAGHRWYDYARNVESRRTDMQFFGLGVGLLIAF